MKQKEDLMTEKPEAQTDEMQTEEQAAARKPDGVLTKKFGAKTFIAEIFFKHDSKDTFQDKLLKVIRSEHSE
jgi:hypothetical protein